MKLCKKCGLEKIIEEFSNNKNEKDGKSLYCKECEKKRKKQYRDKNRNEINEKAKKWRKENPEKYKEIINRYLEKNPHMSSKERGKKYRESEEWKEKFRKSSKEFYLKNLEEVRKKRKEYYYENKEKERRKNDLWRNKKMKTDGFFRMKKRLRERIRAFFKGKSIGKKTKEIVGLDYEEFKNYITNKFTEGMSWENYGEWHLDHIIPLCEAKNTEDLLKLNHYTNLQPLWAKDNLIKNRKYDS
jgi:hypothetical protein